jgi:hypothetical protein
MLTDLATVPTRWRSFIAELHGLALVGTPGVRDVDAPCDAFEPGTPGQGSCQTDGHYMCVECVHIDLLTLRARRDECGTCGTKLIAVGRRSTTLAYCPTCDKDEIARMRMKAIEDELARLERMLRGCRFHFSNEAGLQAQMELAFQKLGEPYRREHPLGEAGRIDFLVGRVGIEVKVRGSSADVGWQLLRYAEHSEVDGILLVTARAQHRELPAAMHDKPLRIYHLLQF